MIGSHFFMLKEIPVLHLKLFFLKGFFFFFLIFINNFCSFFSLLVLQTTNDYWFIKKPQIFFHSLVIFVLLFNYTQWHNNNFFIFALFRAFKINQAQPTTVVARILHRMSTSMSLHYSRDFQIIKTKKLNITH